MGTFGFSSRTLSQFGRFGEQHFTPSGNWTFISESSRPKPSDSSCQIALYDLGLPFWGEGGGEGVTVERQLSLSSEFYISFSFSRSMAAVISRMSVILSCVIWTAYYFGFSFVTPYSSLLETLTVPQLVNKWSLFYVTRRLNTVFTRTNHLSVSWARSIQYTSFPSYFLKLNFNIIPLFKLKSSKCSLSLRFPH